MSVHGEKTGSLEATVERRVFMKQSKHTRKVLRTIAIALKTSVPIAALVFANVSCRNEVCKVVEIYDDSLFGHPLSGMIDQPPWQIHLAEYKVKEGDTWLSIAKRYDGFGSGTCFNTMETLEILLRVNGVSTQESHTIILANRHFKSPESSPLQSGQIIYVPVDAKRIDRRKEIENILSKAAGKAEEFDGETK